MQKRFKNAKILTGKNLDNIVEGDIIVENGKIVCLGKDKSCDFDDCVDLNGAYVLPSFKNCDCNLTGKKSNEFEKYILKNIKSGVTDIIVRNNELENCIDVFDKYHIKGKIVLNHEKISPHQNYQKDKVLIYADPVLHDENQLDQISDLSAKIGCEVFINFFDNLVKTGELNSRSGQLPINYIESFGLLDRGGYLSGAICSDKEDYRLLSEYGFKIVTRPLSDLKKGNGFANSLQIQNAGLELGLGTNDDSEIDMFQNTRALCYGTRGLLCDEDVMSEKEAIQIAISGKIEVGERADFMVLNDRFEENDLIKDIVESATKQDILMIIAEGEIIYKKEV